jgi:hypothetical protein
MTNPTNHVNSNGHGDYERRDVGPALIWYFLIGLAVALVISYFVVSGVFHFLDKHYESQQTPISPLVRNEPTDTRHLPPQYKTDAESTDYEKYLHSRFPEPQLETNERTELNKIRLGEEETLSTYDYVDKSAGTVRMPIDRAMDLLVQRGLPVHQQSGNAASAESKGTKK